MYALPNNTPAFIYHAVQDAAGSLSRGEPNFTVAVPLPEELSPESEVSHSQLLRDVRSAVRRFVQWEARQRGVRERVISEFYYFEYTVGRDIGVTTNPSLLDHTTLKWWDYTITRTAFLLRRLNEGDVIDIPDGDPKEPLFMQGRNKVLKEFRRRFACESMVSDQGVHFMRVRRIPFEQSAYRAPKEHRTPKLVVPSP